MNKRGRPKGIITKKLVFESERYDIYHIPLNYLILVKIKNKKGKRILGDFYSPDDRTLDYAKETAEYMIKKYS